MRHRFALRARGWFVAALCFAALAAPARADEAIVVKLDQAQLIKIPERAATIVIGDPLIADLSVQPGGIAVITGKGFGATNVIVMDHGGAVLMDKKVEVRGPNDPIVVVYRGITRQTYSCTPECSPRITLGDDTDYVTRTLAQSGARNSAAMAAAAEGAASSRNAVQAPSQFH
jgi:Flp pilus assembly secretin CpaC